jgi:hypothetical protein
MKRNRRTPVADPRQVGGVYYSSYWAQTYTVVAMPAAGTWTVDWQDGSRTTHQTQWDRRDRVVSQPGVIPPARPPAFSGGNV